MNRPGSPAIGSRSRILYWTIAGTLAALGIVLVFLPLFPWHVYVGAGWLLFALFWVLMPLWAWPRRSAKSGASNDVTAGRR